MLDFYSIKHTRKGGKEQSYNEARPSFNNTVHKDLMVRGGQFYAAWNHNTGLWTTKSMDVIPLVDQDLYRYAEDLEKKEGLPTRVKTMQNNDDRVWQNYLLFLTRLPDNFIQLDTSVTFTNTLVTKESYVSRRLPYALEEGPTEAFDELFGVLYDPENLTKLMWAIGSIVEGDSKDIQKLYVLHGLPGTGKSTSLNLIARLFQGYSVPFEAGAMARSSSSFPLEPLKDNPLIAFDHEGDLSTITRNTVLTSVVSHDELVVNAKYQGLYRMRLNTTLFVATNKPVHITDRGSGLIRRLVDIIPTGQIVTPLEYDQLVSRLEFELGAIAWKCWELYKQLGINHYERYVSTRMLKKTNHLYNFIVENSLMFQKDAMVPLTDAWRLYKAYCEEVEIKHRLNRNQFRDEFREYWDEFHDRKYVDGTAYRSLFMGFKLKAFQHDYRVSKGEVDIYSWLVMDVQNSILDDILADQPAQAANDAGTPLYKWDNVTTKLSDIDTKLLHYVLPKGNLITIDLDLKGPDAEKSLDLNVEAAKRFPPTYAETSKSGSGLHLHYYYDGDVGELSRVYDVDIEVLVPTGKMSLRRKLLYCNDFPIETINSGLPLKEQKDDMTIRKVIGNERSLRLLLLRNVAKDIHPATKPSVDFIKHILDEAYAEGIEYDVRDLRERIVRLANGSTNNRDHCLSLIPKMKFKSDHVAEIVDDAPNENLVFFDVEVYPNLLVVCWKGENASDVVKMVNPSPSDVATLMNYRLVGFNNRMYDNHILYGRMMGEDNMALYHRSRGIIGKEGTGTIGKAFGISYADVHNYASKKQGLKKWEIELGIPHDEMDAPWDEPLPEELWDRATEYCANDVLATEALHHARSADFHAREILAELSGLRVNDSTWKHVARILFDTNDKPQSEFNIPDLSKEFLGYEFDQYAPKKQRSTYRGEYVGEGGYVYAEPGMYNNVVYMDIASMHPTSLVLMNMFGPYTEKFQDILTARILIKEGRLGDAGRMFGGKLAPFLQDDSEAEGLAYALKIALNSVYGFTASPYDRPFMDKRNVENVVAKRGALFMIDLKHALQERGCKPIHFKTDSVKIAEYTDDDVQFVIDFGKKYGYDFGVEGIFDRMVLINDAVLIGRWSDAKEWHAVGARFAEPYVFKSLFTDESILFDDMTITRAVQKGTMYLETASGELKFMGKVGKFCPMQSHGGTLYRIDGDKKHAVTGTTGYTFMPADEVKGLGMESDIDTGYFLAQVEEALEKIAEFGDPTIFIGDKR